jgi:Nucleotidyl transferase AbiEii toxin, Type IV TA system
MFCGKRPFFGLKDEGRFRRAKISWALYGGTRLAKNPKERREQIRAMLQEAATTGLNDYFEFLRRRSGGRIGRGAGRRQPVSRGSPDGRTYSRAFIWTLVLGMKSYSRAAGRRRRTGLARVRGHRDSVLSGNLSRTPISEKLHALSLPRGERENTRTKDLIDMVLLIGQQKLDRARTKVAIEATFANRATHALPQSLTAPSGAWEPVFRALARECGLAVSLTEGFAIVEDFFGKLADL